MKEVSSLSATLLSPLVFPHLETAAVTHGVFSRRGGASPPPFDALNVGFQVGDDRDKVRQNREMIKRTLGVESLVSAKQVHGSQVLVVDEPVNGDQEADGYDALISSVPGPGLMVQQADCQAVLLFAPEKRVVGNIHNGWRGSVANIIGRTVAAMTRAFGVRPAGLRAAISPALGPCCAEFVNFQAELPSSFHAYQVRPDYFDFWAISRDQLIDAGLRPENIRAAGTCTVCDRNYFSFRRDGVTGRFASVIGLRRDLDP